jgi:hypothetical protein
VWNRGRMSHGKPKRYETWMEGKSPFAPEISRLLPRLILELALLDDVTGPSASEVARDEYVAELARRLREPVTRELLRAGISVSEEQLARICHVAASETFVIRRLNQARLEGEILAKDFNHLPFYRTYKDYFEQTPDVVLKAYGLRFNSAASDSAARRGSNKN